MVVEVPRPCREGKGISASPDLVILKAMSSPPYVLSSVTRKLNTLCESNVEEIAFQRHSFKSFEL